MPKITATIPDYLIERLREIANSEDKSFSKTVNEIIELGLKFYEEKQKYSEKCSENSALSEDEKEPDRTQEYLRRILNVCHEIFRFTYDAEKSKYSSHYDQNGTLEFIKEDIKNSLKRWRKE